MPVSLAVMFQFLPNAPTGTQFRDPALQGLGDAIFGLGRPAFALELARVDGGADANRDRPGAQAKCVGGQSKLGSADECGNDGDRIVL